MHPLKEGFNQVWGLIFPPVNQINEGLKLMFLGMTGVFLFLVVMVTVISIMAFFFKRFHKGESGTGTVLPDRGHIAAISAAISAFLRIQTRE